MEYDSVLGQQSISGKNVSLILCVWKPCYVKSGHNHLFSSRYPILLDLNHVYPAPLEQYVDVLAKRKTEINWERIELRERHLTFYQGKIKNPMASWATTMGMCSPETSDC